jgi:hypothetical protein
MVPSVRLHMSRKIHSGQSRYPSQSPLVKYLA